MKTQTELEIDNLISQNVPVREITIPFKDIKESSAIGWRGIFLGACRTPSAIELDPLLQWLGSTISLVGSYKALRKSYEIAAICCFIDLWIAFICQSAVYSLTRWNYFVRVFLLFDCTRACLVKCCMDFKFRFNRKFHVGL